MRRSQIDNLTWSFHTNGNASSSNVWPELCPVNHGKNFARKKEFINIVHNNRTMILDSLEYPELGCDVFAKNKNSIMPRELHFPNTDMQVVSCVSMPAIMEPKKARSLKRYKRPDKICINLQEALESTRCMNKANDKELPRLRINIYRGNMGITIPNSIDRNRQSDFRKVRICISKDRKPSRLKRIILVNRDMKARVNIQKRQAFQCANVNAICGDIDTIDFNTLKITGETDMDRDYVKDMSTMSLYDNNYRNTNEVNISENTMFHRPDLIDKINNLKIQGRLFANRCIANNNGTLISQFETDVFEDDIVHQTFSLRIEEEIKEDIESSTGVDNKDFISCTEVDNKNSVHSTEMDNKDFVNSTEVDNKDFVKFSRNFREYCTNMLTPSLNDSTEKLIKGISRLQGRFYEKYPNKSKYKRRYCSGLKEVSKQVELKKVKLLIIAPDIEKVELKDGLDDQINKLKEMCRKQDVVFCFALRRRKLGYYTHGSGLAACLGIVNYSGLEELFNTVLIELVHARNAFKKQNGGGVLIDISKVILDDNLLSENINALSKCLSHDLQTW